MGRDRNETRSTQQKQPAATQGNFLYSSFHPNTAQRETIAKIDPSVGALVRAIEELADRDLVLTVKIDGKGTGLVATVRENKEYGSACAACSMYHRDGLRLCQMLIFWTETMLETWVNNPTASSQADNAW